MAFVRRLTLAPVVFLAVAALSYPATLSFVAVSTPLVITNLVRLRRGQAW